MVSHIKFLKKKDQTSTKIFYVKDAQEIIMYDIVSKKKTSLGKALGSIIAFNVSDGGQGNDLEENKVSNDAYRVICLDETKTISIFTNLLGKKSQLHFDVS